MNAILTEPFESHTYKHQSNSAGFFKIIPHPTYETAHTGIEWVCIGPGSILWGFICFVYYILFSWFCHAAVCSVSLQKFVSSLGEERFWDLVTAPQRVLCRLISLRTVTWQVWLGCCIFSFLFFFSGLQMKRLLTPFYIGLHFIFQNLVWMPFTSFFLSSWKENQYCIRTAVAVMGHQSLSRLTETTVSSGIWPCIYHVE